MKRGAIHVEAPPAVALLRARGTFRAFTPCRDWFAERPDLVDGRMFGNDALGDCVPVADYRVVQFWGGAISEAAVLARYSMVGGYDPARPASTDRGTDAARDMLNWCAAPIVDADGRAWPIWWARVEPHDNYHLAAALAWTPLLATFALPSEDVMGDGPGGWDRAPGDGPEWAPSDAHRVVLGSIEPHAVLSWGQRIEVHPAFFARYCVAVDVPIPRSVMTAPELAWAGLDLDALEADVAALLV